MPNAPGEPLPPETHNDTENSMTKPSDETAEGGGSCAPLGGSAASMPRPTIEELERMLASGEPLKIQLQPDGSLKAVRPVVCAITECDGMAAMIDMLAAHASEDDHKSGEYGNWCHDSEILRMAARILKRYSEPLND